MENYVDKLMYPYELEQIRTKVQNGESLHNIIHVNPNMDITLALPGSEYNDVLCPRGYKVSGVSNYCCIPSVEKKSGGLQEDEPPTKQQKGLHGNPIPRGKFGRLYRKIRPNANETKINGKYKLYLKCYECKKI